MIVRFRGLARSLTGRESRNSLAKATARFNGIIASAMDAIISVDAGQRVILFNPAAERMFGIATDEALGQPLNRFIPDRFRAAHTGHIERFGETGVSNRHMGALGKIYGLRANGQEFPIEASISQVEVGGEQIFTVILRDITLRERTEQALQAAREELASANQDLEHRVRQRTAKLRETVAELEAFSYSLSHDMRAPLRAIQSYVELALQQSAEKLEPQAAQFLRNAIAAAQRMDRLILDMLALARLSDQHLQLQPLNPEDLVRRITAGRSNLQPPQTEVRIESPLLPVLAHETLLAQCLVNLLDNAVKFVPHGSKPQIRIWTEEVHGPESAVHSPRSAVHGPQSTVHGPQSTASSIQHPVSSIRLWIEDNGIGIKPEARQKIFGIFQRLHSAQEFEGTGIGLAIVRRAAEKMGGRAGVESEPGQSSRFWLELPKPSP